MKEKAGFAIFKTYIRSRGIVSLGSIWMGMPSGEGRGL